MYRVHECRFQDRVEENSTTSRREAAKRNGACSHGAQSEQDESAAIQYRLLFRSES